LQRVGVTHAILFHTAMMLHSKVAGKSASYNGALSAGQTVHDSR